MTVAAMVAAQFREHAVACPRAKVRLGGAVMGLGVIALVTVTRTAARPKAFGRELSIVSPEFVPGIAVVSPELPSP